ncbi:MAG: hypothetical protein M3Z23_12120 [Acidobacteriota bacterium]|nr:hypothetical protein [Acidobacteriota bacterium]
MPATAVLAHNAKVTLAATLVSVFLCGAMAGALIMNFAIDPHHTVDLSRRPKKVELEKWKRDLDLTDDQTKKLVTVLDDFSKYYDNVLADGKTRVLQILNDDQKRKFEKMMKNPQ